MNRANSWRSEGGIRHDRIDLFLFGQEDVGIDSLINSWMGDMRGRTLCLDGRKKRLRVRKVCDETELRNYIRISQSRPHGVLFVFDVSLKETFMYMIALLEKLRPVFNSNTIRYLVGTKRDLRTGSNDDPNEATVEDAVMVAMRNLMRYRETSAVSDVHRLGLRLENQSLMANLGSYMSLPRKGGEDLIMEFDRKLSVDSDSSELSSDVSSGSDLGDYIKIERWWVIPRCGGNAAMSNRFAPCEDPLNDLNDSTSHDAMAQRLYSPPLSINLELDGTIKVNSRGRHQILIDIIGVWRELVALLVELMILVFGYFQNWTLYKCTSE
ncbi:Down syndrome cell adhesion molecule protein Dscam2-like [Tropilaelaps mercedesae]|uniref:Down syndrome cell adhesion molecule protein Dscam2-like n=1 Tax=Tropilaelaps mercedesae TaxID=418985 RepID=A0A1V9XFR3_9ACAR|nr:Down syndrome cell adhesion molecule protein Dscam2-like [Tropilaelaps mercedesae]